jgi:uncharacterized membrane protein SirB2
MPDGAPSCASIRSSRRFNKVIEFYSQIRLLHIAFVLMSGSLFCLRGLMVLAGSSAADHVALRWLSYGIDTALLTAALMLMTLLHQYPIAQSWLTVKLLLVLVYVVCGSLALRRANSAAARRRYFAFALACYLFIVTVAITHSPYGFLRSFID